MKIGAMSFQKRMGRWRDNRERFTFLRWTAHCADFVGSLILHRSDPFSSPCFGEVGRAAQLFHGCRFAS